MKNNNNTSSGIGIDVILTIVFVILKLCGIINWSWWWVLSPLWIGFAFLVVCIVVIAIIRHITKRRF